MQSFDGIRVVDFTHVLAGPFCTSQLAALGADVIKVEAVDEPDMMRPEGSHAALSQSGQGSHFVSQNTNKRSLAVALNTRQGLDIIAQLIATSDVVVENFRCGVLARHGLDAASLREKHPHLICCSISGFGHTGPKAQDPAYDNVVQAFSGMMAMTGGPDTGPVRVGPPVMDYGTGAQAAFAIAAALFRRERGGVGQRIDVSMLDCALMLMSNVVVETQVTGTAPVRYGNTNLERHGYGCFETAAGHIMVGAFTQKQTAALYGALGLHDESERIAHCDRAEFIASSADGRDTLAIQFLRHPASHWEALLNRNGVPAARVRELNETLEEPQVKARPALDHARLAASPALLTPVAGFACDEGGPAIKVAAPRHGEHTVDILTSLGYDAVDIEGMRESGVLI